MKRTELSLLSVVTAALVLSACQGDSAENLLASAKTHIQKKDMKSAAVQLKNALQVNAGMAEARFLLGEILLDNGDTVGAQLELNKAPSTFCRHCTSHATERRWRILSCRAPSR